MKFADYRSCSVVKCWCADAGTMRKLRLSVHRKNEQRKKYGVLYRVRVPRDIVSTQILFQTSLCPLYNTAIQVLNCHRDLGILMSSDP